MKNDIKEKLCGRKSEAGLVNLDFVRDTNIGGVKGMSLFLEASVGAHLIDTYVINALKTN